MSAWDRRWKSPDLSEPALHQPTHRKAQDRHGKVTGRAPAPRAWVASIRVLVAASYGVVGTMS